MRILIVDTFYGPYLARIYSQEGLVQKPWREQHRAHFDGGFGTGDAYSHGLKLLGVEAIEIVANSLPLQRAWAKEHRPDLLQLKDTGQQLFAILEAQIHWYEATILYVQDINWMPASFIKHVRQSLEMVVGQNACPLAGNLDLGPYDLLLTSLPHYVGRFRAMGVQAAYFPIAFDERLLQRHHNDGSRDHALTFVGGLGGFHSKGTQMLDAIAQELPLEVWGYGGQQLPPDSILRQRWQGEAWAEEMYDLLANSQITINRHIDIAETYANNMRLYEATGMGACLLTDTKLNLPCLFEPDREVVTYSSPSEAISKLKQLMAEPKAAAEIAARGQARTLKDHTYKQRMAELVSLIQRHLPKTEQIQLKLPKPQTLLVACSSHNIHRIPRPLKHALRNQHSHHRIFLISDANPHMPDLQGIKRWSRSDLLTDKTQAEPCLDAIEPNQILIVDNQPSGTTKANWIIDLKKQAEARHILCTYVRT